MSSNQLEFLELILGMERRRLIIGMDSFVVSVKRVDRGREGNDKKEKNKKREKKVEGIRRIHV